MPEHYAIHCYTCFVKVREGTYADDAPPIDGQVVLTAYADSVPGDTCPSGVAGCPHKAVAVAERAKHRPATLADVELLTARVGALEKGELRL